MAVQTQSTILDEMKQACLAFGARDMALFNKARKISIDPDELIDDLISTALEADQETNVELIRAVAYKVMSLPQQLPPHLRGSRFSDREREELHCLPLYQAKGTAADDFDPYSRSKANTIIAQLAHGKISDGTLTLDELRETMIASITETYRQYTAEDEEEINKILYLTEECAKIRKLPYDIVGTFRQIQNLVGMLEEGQKDSPEYKKRKRQYEVVKNRNLDLLVGSESLILNSRYPARVTAVRMRDMLDEMQMLWSTGPSLDAEARQYLRLTAQHAMGLYYQLMERFGWSKHMDDLGFLVMEILEPGAFVHLNAIVNGWPDNAHREAKHFLKNLASTDPQLQAKIKEYGIELNWESRKKSVFSTWLKIFNDSIYNDTVLSAHTVHDAYGLRLVVDGACDESKLIEMLNDYAALIERQSASHQDIAETNSVVINPQWKTTITKSEDKNYIANPKPNGYRTRQFRLVFHMQQRGSDQASDVNIEIQLRTQAMHDHAVYGNAFHGESKLNPANKMKGVNAAATEVMAKETSEAAEAVAKHRVPPEIDANRRTRRILMVRDFGNRMKKERVQHEDLPTYVTVRTKLGKCLDLPKFTTDGKPMRLLDSLYLLSRSLGRKSHKLFDNLVGVIIDGITRAELTDFSPAMLSATLSNAQSVEVMIDESQTINPRWAEYCNLNAAIDYIALKTERLQGAIPRHYRPITRRSPEALAVG